MKSACPQITLNCCACRCCWLLGTWGNRLGIQVQHWYTCTCKETTRRVLAIVKVWLKVFVCRSVKSDSTSHSQLCLMGCATALLQTPSRSQSPCLSALLRKPVWLQKGVEGRKEGREEGSKGGRKGGRETHLPCRSQHKVAYFSFNN